VARRPLEREGVCLDGGRRTTQLMRDSLGSPLMPRLSLLISSCLLGVACGPASTPPTISTTHPPTSCAGIPGSDTTIYDTSQVSEKPVLRRYSRVEYPRDAQSNHIEGRTLLTAVVNTDGRIDTSSVKVVQGDLLSFELAARRAVRNSVFWPGCKGNVAARVRVAIPFQWTIEIDR
jgi:TonB family protein